MIEKSDVFVSIDGSKSWSNKRPVAQVLDRSGSFLID
jgi:hypothetical protein